MYWKCLLQASSHLLAHQLSELSAVITPSYGRLNLHLRVCVGVSHGAIIQTRL